MIKIIPRRIASLMEEQSLRFPVLALTGPRQSGKTTLLKSLFKDFTYVSLENLNIREFATQDPVGFLNQYNSKVIFDEVQRVPSLFSYIQTRVDETGEMGQFILSGSQNFQLVNSITQSLAGRVAIFNLLPLDFNELKFVDQLEENYADAAVKGCYPAIFDRDINSTIYYSNYVQTYLEKDVRELITVKDLRTFRMFLRLCAGRAGQLMNFQALANDCDVSYHTIKSWLFLLESSYIIFFLHPFHENFNKRLIKSPKLYFYDSGLLSFLLGIKSSDDLFGDRLKGQVFENMVVAEFQKKNYHLYQHFDYFFWQDNHANEIDLIYKGVSGYTLYEIKSTETIGTALFKELDRFETMASPARVLKNLVYGGNENEFRSAHTVLSWRNIADQ